MREAANISEQPVAVTDAEMDASDFLPYAAETMLRELEKLPSESKTLTNLFLKLSHVSALQRYCSNASCSTVPDITEDDICLSKIRHNACEQKSGHSCLHGAQARIANLEESSRDIVSMFIPPDAPKLSFSSDSVGMSRN